MKVSYLNSAWGLFSMLDKRARLQKAQIDETQNKKPSI